MTVGAGAIAHLAGIPATLAGCAVLAAVLVAALGRRRATTPTGPATPDTGPGTGGVVGGPDPR